MEGNNDLVEKLRGNMKHFGDICELKGSELPLVDIVTGGSPCQDLSVAGKRQGLAGERSGLFMEQIRIIKEMRDESTRRLQSSGTDIDRQMVKPRFMVWENVPGAFSSNKGEDFRVVLEETARVADKTAVIPRPPKGKWSTSGCIMGDGWSIAWRVHDAQFWGVPQRRRRIALVADFIGGGAPEVLFERESVSGHSETCREERKDSAGDVETCTTETSKCLNSWDVRGDSPTHSGPSVVCLEGNGNRPSHKGNGYSESETMYTLNSTEKHAVCTKGGSEPTISSKASFFLKSRSDGTADTLVATDYKDPQIVCYGIDRASFNQGKNAKFGFSIEENLAQTIVAKGPGGNDRTVGALCARDFKGVGNQYVDEGKLILQNIGESSGRQQNQNL
jgi:DNA (cytosine-5)-methyltransferase 1